MAAIRSLLLVGAGLVLSFATHAVPLVGLQNGNTLVFFDSDAPSSAIATRPITDANGLPLATPLIAIDRRPANGFIYAVGANSQIYLIDFAGRATAVGSPLAVPLTGTSFGFDFNPAADRIRIVSNTGQNLRINPDTGALVDGDAVTPGTQPDGNLNGATTSATAAGYTQNFAGTTATVLLVYDPATDTFFIQNPPNAGTTTSAGVTGGAIGIDSGPTVSFEITAAGQGFLLLTPGGGAPQLYSIAVTTVPGASPTATFGAPVLLGALPIGVTSITEVTALPGVTTPASVDTLGTLGKSLLAIVLGLLAFGFVRRRAVA